MSFRDSFKLMLDSVAANKPFEECKQILVENISLDPSFKTFYEWCLQNDIPIIVLSSGMAPIIRVLLRELVGPSVDNIEIIANDVRDKLDGTWEIVFHDKSHFGHDKSIAIREYREEREKLPENEQPVFFYCGDGVSDLSAAKETEVLFAKIGHDLITYCQRENIPFKVFSDFQDIHREVQAVVEGKKTIQQLAEEGAKEAAEQNLADPSRK